MTRLIYVFFLFFTLLYGQIPNIRVSSPSSTDPNETSIAINPVDTSNLVAGANIRYYYYSTDGGYTWTQGNLTSPLGVWGDPCVVFDANGNCYFGHLSNPSSGGYWIDRIVVQKSTNKGINWSSGVGIGYNPPSRNQDKEWLAVDWTNSLYRNNIYCAWTEFDSYGSTNPNDSSRILFSRSTDGGLTWSAPVRVSDTGGDCIDEDNTVEGAVPAVGPNGEVYLAWAGPLGLVFDKSTDGGLTWGQDKILTSIPGGWDFNVPGIYRCNGLPITACDISNSPYRGTIYVNWSDQRNGTNNTDIFLVKSTDGGNTWTAPKKLNQDNTQTHQFFTWMTVDPTTGFIYIVYYDRRAYTDNKTDVYVARSTDGGETFTEFKVSQSPFTPSSSVFFGDYTNIVALNGKVYPIWTRMDGTQRSVWIAIIKDSIPQQSTSSFLLNAGWNLLSVPLRKNNMHYKQLFPGSNSLAYTFDNNYVSVDTLEVGKGYWLKFPVAQNVTLMGNSTSQVSIPVRRGWNLVGSLNGEIPVNSIQTDPPGILVTPFYEYNQGYNIVSNLVKGKGYWVKSSSQGLIELSLSGLKFSNVQNQVNLDKFDRLVFETKFGSSSLFIADNVINREYFELPPIPPSNIFDVRFDDNTNILFTSETKRVNVQANEFPISVHFISKSSNKKIKLRFNDGREVVLSKDQKVLLNLRNEASFFITAIGQSVKEKFVVEQFPNPFNSSTKIRYYIPKGDNDFFNIHLNIYDLLGRIVHHHQEQVKNGYHEIIFDATQINLPTNTYFCEIILFDIQNNTYERKFIKMNYIK